MTLFLIQVGLFTLRFPCVRNDFMHYGRTRARPTKVHIKSNCALCVRNRTFEKSGPSALLQVGAGRWLPLEIHLGGHRARSAGHFKSSHAESLPIFGDLLQ